MSVFQDDEFIRVRELQRIDIKPDELLVAKLGVEGMNMEQIHEYCAAVGRTLRENLPTTKIMITTVTNQNPFNLYSIRIADVEQEDDSSTIRTE